MTIGFFELATSYESKMGLSVPETRSVVDIVNSTGNRFTLSVSDLILALEDLLDKNDRFLEAGEQYNETRWREASKTLFRSDAVKTLASTQTKAFFTVLSRLVSAARKMSGRDFDENRLDLGRTSLKLTLEAFGEATDNNSSVPYKVATNRAATPAMKGENILLYGAPGTGKSKAANDDALLRTAGKSELVFRTVFHGDTMQGDFIGAIRPKLDGASVSYGFAPGPFSRALKAAVANPSEHVVLIIEELNRANAAAAFGEVFQLLDRDEFGASCYEVHPENEELSIYVYGSEGEEKNASQATIYIPSNLSLIATMNSADQGVKSIDMAFRRRWKAIYQRLDVSRASDVFVWLDPTLQMSWRDFLGALNDYLVSEFATEEDRLIGQYFASETDLEDGRIPDKLLLYLWDDLLRGEDRSALFSGNLRTYAHLQAEAHDRGTYFSEGFLTIASQWTRQG